MQRMSDFRVSIGKQVSFFPIKEISNTFDDLFFFMLYIFPIIECGRSQVGKLLELQSEMERHVGDILYRFYQV